MGRFDYQVVRPTSGRSYFEAEQLNALGAEGWELTAIAPDACGLHVAYLRREVETEPRTRVRELERRAVTTRRLLPAQLPTDGVTQE